MIRNRISPASVILQGLFIGHLRSQSGCRKLAELKNQEFVHMACESNVRNTIEAIRMGSPILKEMQDKGEIQIVGAIYDMDDGSVDFLQ